MYLSIKAVLFFFIAEKSFNVWICQFISLFTRGWAFWLCLDLEHEQVFLQTYAFIALGEIPRVVYPREIAAGLLGR